MKTNIDDRYFGVTSLDPNTGELRTWNLFDHYGIKRAVADWVLMSPQRKSEVENPLRYLFRDVWSRCEYECVICPWPFPKGAKVEDVGEKYDIYTLYVEPNAMLLLDMVDNVSAKSAREWRTADNKRLKGAA